MQVTESQHLYPEQINARYPKGTRERVNAIARERTVSRSQWIRETVMRAVRSAERKDAIDVTERKTS